MASEQTTSPTVDDRIRYEVSGGVARITIDAVDRGNALDASMRDGLTELFEWASADLGVRVVVLTGAGDRHFCTGADLGGAVLRGANLVAEKPCAIGNAVTHPAYTWYTQSRYGSVFG